MTLPRYQEYKDSGVAWMGDVPAHWQKRNLQDVAKNERYSFVDGPFGSDLKNEEYSDSGVPLIQLNNISIGLHNLDSLKFVPVEKANQLEKHNAFPGDIVIAKMADPVARAAIVSSDFDQYLIVADCVRLTVDQSSWNVNFVQYWINSPPINAIAETLAGGITRVRINLGVLKKLPVFRFPLEEQQTIAAFLDRETGKIDALIAEQQRLVELLAEKRQVVISHAVTKGLTPNVAMKNSGIEWLGEVPGHWEISRIKRICYINDGNHGEEYPSAEDYTDESDGVPFIRAGNICGLSITSQDMLFITKEKNDSMRKGRLETGDILFTNRGEIGKIAVIPPEYKGANLNSQIAYLRSDESVVVSKYFAHYLASDVVISVYDSISAGSVLTQFPIGDLKNIPAILPPITEQIAIATFLDSETAKFDTLTAEANHAIELLQERRSALISAAVTGKIDVRTLTPSYRTGERKMLETL